MSLTTRVSDLATRIGLEIKNLKVTVDNKEPIIVTKLSAFNKNFGTTAGTVAEGNDSRILNGQTAFGWGNHSGLYPSLTGTGATGTWGINISGNAQSATNWGGRPADLNAIQTDFDLVLTRGSADAVTRLTPLPQFKNWLGLGSNAYNSTAYQPANNTLFKSLGALQSNVNANTIVGNGYYLNVTGNGTGNSNFPLGYGTVSVIGNNTDDYSQIQTAYQTNGEHYVRGRWAGDYTPWRKVWDDGNFNPANYLPLSGGTLTGALNGTSANFSGICSFGEGFAGPVLRAYNSNLGENANISISVGKLADVNNSGFLVWQNDLVPSKRYLSLETFAGANPLRINASNFNVTTSGAANFTSSVTATNINLATTSEFQLNYQRTGISKSWGIGSDNSGTYFINKTDYILPLYLANSGAATFSSSVTAGGNLITTASSVANGILGITTASWGGGGNYPTLYSSHADGWVMHINPHISYTQNGVNGYTGSMTGSTIRMASQPNASTHYDIGVGTCNVGEDNFSIGRNNVSYFKIVSGGAVTFSSSVAATSFNGAGTGLTGYAIGLNIGGNAASATRLSTSISLLEHPGSGTIGYAYNIMSSTSGLFPASDNSNSVLNINRHGGEYNSQLGFSSNGSIYYRSFSATTINTTQPWRLVIDSSNVGSQSVNYANTAGSSGSTPWTGITGKADWLNTASLVGSHADANSWRDSGFYENEGGGSNWPTNTWYNSINVRHSNQGNYHGFQAAMSFYDNKFWFRSYNGHGTFQGWEHAISNATIGSQSVNYATSSGSASSAGRLTGPAATNGSDGWFRSDGQAGWFNSTYAVGIYATEAGKVRTYNGASFSAPAFYQESDMRLKTLVNKPYSDVRDIQAISYLWKDPNKSKEVQVGYSAQQVKEYMPSAVTEDSEGVLSVNYIQVLIAKIESMEKRIKELENGI